ncbi:MAG TPA: riboflavin synthase [Chitinophagaceae bacterium]|jgi:riboflavin synthase|nr:riboflavin synthase [Chitinophagaceae bacterium]
MFTGIVETTGIVKKVISNGSNRTFWIASSISSQLKPDQSVGHNGVCLTIERTHEDQHRVTAIEETLQKTNLGDWKQGDIINLERCLLLTDRLDGHIVQGHVDTTGTCTRRIEKGGSWEFEFGFPKKFAELIIEKGSICVNGISLTVFDAGKKTFRVAVIPYTFEHTNINKVEEGSNVNLEFDILGKYLLRRSSLKKA